MKPRSFMIGAAAWSTSSNSASTMNASGCTGPPTKTGSSAPGSPSSSGTASAAATSEGLLSTRPIAPSSSWWATRTTVLRKFGSTRLGEETSSLPWSEVTLRELPPGAICKRLQDAFCDYLAVHLVRPVVDPAGAGLHQHAGERRLVGQAARPVYLACAVDDVVQDPRGEELDRGHLDACLVAGVDLVRGVEGHEPAGL